MAKPDEPQVDPQGRPAETSSESEHEKRNEGEGSQTGARQYREGLESFQKSGRVDEAAESAREAIEGDERADLETAEATGKARMAEEDPELSAFPTWWDRDFDSTWDRMKTALRRDWEQTKQHIWRNEGQDLNQGTGDTVKQAVGKQPIPREGVPNPLDLAYDDAEPALRFGHGASLHHGKQEWSDELESNLERDWESGSRKLEWKRARPYVRHGFRLGRTSLH